MKNLILFFSLTFCSVLYSQNIKEIGNVLGSEGSFYGEVILNEEKYKPVYTGIKMNKDATFLQFVLDFYPKKNNVKSITITVHLDKPIGEYNKGDKIIFKSYRQDTTNSSHDKFAHPGFVFDQPLKPLQYSAWVYLEDDNRYKLAEWFNTVESEISAIYEYGEYSNYYLKFDIKTKLIEALKSDRSNSKLGNDLDAKHNLEIKGEVIFKTPKLYKK